MYCSTCGVAVPESLSYCNHCGARIAKLSSEKIATARNVKPDLLIPAMVGTFVLGLFAITALLGVMKSVLGLAPGQILGFAVVSFFILIFLEGVFLRLLFWRDRGADERAGTEAVHATKELGAPQAQALPEPLSSVTDHTTRAFDPIYANRNKTT